MIFAKIKKIRVYLSLFFFTVTLILFLDIIHILPANITPYFLYFQFVPSTIKFFNQFSLLATGFIVVLILTFLFGRVYCSSICPLGTFQDIISRLAQFFNKQKYFSLLNDFRILKYGILTATILSLFSGSLIVLNLLDPFSLAGKIFSNIFRLLLIPLNNLTALTLEQFNIYRVYPIEVKALSWIAISFSTIVLLIIGIMSFNKGRLFCNTVCPVGTLLGLTSRLSFYKIKIEETDCSGCGVCETVCKAGCIDNENKKIDFDRCVSCFNCFTVCPSNGIVYKRSNLFFSIKVNKQIDADKRKFFTRLFFGIVGLSEFLRAQVKVIPKKESTIPVIKKLYPSPPGSVGVESFYSNCTACHLCVAACPTHVLQPSFLEHGVFNILQPYLDNSAAYCTFECIRCTEVCPTGAILPLTINKKKTLQIGKTHFVKENCVVETEGTSCGACSEHCPTKAVIMIPYKNNIKLPEVRNEYCVGCGACEYACPTKPFKAIYVEGNLIHQIAKEAPEERFEQEIDYKEEFPF
ncbi:MAG: 4Fe-4S dicluster domain-containing protein [Ignavibacteriaceae bacterium]|jgi:ferredoxin|nr:4Fe-4S dicluster domain-containing protein [Ignavibacteriaceae bacterium]MCU0364837.1 4Fe-4S dicluster domain-containing protein [Ignavibacteriaceae bacterium]